MLENEALVSVVMPNYNKGRYAVEAVGSVLTQDCPRLELIFVDDASTDGSAAEVQRLYGKNKQVKFALLAENVGGAAARNRGLALATGRFLLFMDSDDLMAPGALIRMLDLFEASPGCDFIAFPMALFDKTPGDSERISNVPKAKDDLLRFLERDHPWLISGPFWKREFLRALGGFDESLSSQQDYDLHVRALLERPRYRYMAYDTLVYYRQHVDSAPRQTSQRLEALRMRAAMILKHLKLINQKGMRSAAGDRAMAHYLLDLALMVRWHKDKLGSRSTQEGLKLWLLAHENSLVDVRTYSQGMGYIRFKHNMLWNRVPALQQRIEARYLLKLAQLLHCDPPTLGRLTLQDV
jgi:glycosyltransferase involved in cell wall biosynthesis